MALEVQQPTFSNGGGGSFCSDDEVYVTLIMASAKSQVKFSPLPFPILRNIFAYEALCEGLVKTFLSSMNIPQTFFNGHDCDMVGKLSRMLRSPILQRRGVHKDYFSVVIMVFEASCQYKILNSSRPFHAKQFPSSEFVQSVCEGGESSLPAGASAVQRLKIDEDKEDNCAICMQGFPSGSGAAKLPCSHVYHDRCIMKWFVQSGTCPMCRFPCS